MIVLLLIALAAILIAICFFFWKSGFLFDAERPVKLEDRPVKDARAREAFRKRLARWRDEGRVSREEFERVSALCENEWDESTMGKN